MSRSELESESALLAERLGTLHGVKSPEFFDKKVLSAFVSSLKEQGFIEQDEGTGIRGTTTLLTLEQHLKALLPARIYQSIQHIV